MPVARPRLLRRRDAVASAIVSFVCLANVATTAIVWTCLRPRVRESEDLASRAVQLSESCLNETRNNISNMLTYLAFRDTENAINTGFLSNPPRSPRMMLSAFTAMAKHVHLSTVISTVMINFVTDDPSVFIYRSCRLKSLSS